MMYTVHNGSHYCLFCFQILEILQHTENNDLIHCFLQFPMQIAIFSLKKLQSFQIVSTRRSESRSINETLQDHDNFVLNFLQQGNVGIIIFNLFEFERLDRRTILVSIQRNGWVKLNLLGTWVAINWVTGSCYQALLSTSVHLSCPINKSFDIPSTDEIW